MALVRGERWQWLENVDQTHLVLASGKPVLQKNFITQKVFFSCDRKSSFQASWRSKPRRSRASSASFTPEISGSRNVPVTARTRRSPTSGSTCWPRKTTRTTAASSRRSGPCYHILVHSTELACLLLTQRPRVWFSASSRIFLLMLLRFIDCTAWSIRYRLDNVNQTLIYLANLATCSHYSW